jgi:hypothetical protein
MDNNNEKKDLNAKVKCDEQLENKKKNDKKIIIKKIDENHVLPKKAPSTDKKEIINKIVLDPPQEKINKNITKNLPIAKPSNHQKKPSVSKNPALNVNPYK